MRILLGFILTFAVAPASAATRKHGMPHRRARTQAGALPQAAPRGATHGSGPSGGITRFSPSRGSRPGIGAPGTTAAGQPGPALVGTQNMGTVIGPAAPAGKQSVQGGPISQTADATNAGPGQGLHWSPPDTPPSVSAGAAGGSGATTNSTTIINNTTNSHSGNTNGN